MLRQRQIATFALVCFSLLSLAQCSSKDSKSKDVSFSLTPDNPVVIDADLTLPDETKIAKPWFLMGFKLKNGSDSTLVFVTANIKATNFSSGSKVTFNYSINPSDRCADEDNDDVYERIYLAIIPPGEVFTSLNPSDLTPIVEYCNFTSISSTGSEEWYIPGLPEADSFAYLVVVEAQGWFADDDGEAIERLVATASLFTR
jgi:hypothetical protein